jgi:hypothetical protein
MSDAIDIVLGQVVEIAWASFRDYITRGYTVVDEQIRLDGKPAPEMRFTVVSLADKSKTRIKDWTPIRIWKSVHGSEWEIHVSDGRGNRISTGRMIGPGPNVVLNPEKDFGKYQAVIESAARLMASHVNSEIAAMAK